MSILIFALIVLVLVVLAGFVIDSLVPLMCADGRLGPALTLKLIIALVGIVLIAEHAGLV